MELLIVGRLFVLVLVAVSILWIPMIQVAQGSQLFVYIQNITSYLAPPVCAVYLLAIFIPRINEQGAFWGLMVGLVVGLIRFGLEFGYSIPPCGAKDENGQFLMDPRPEIIKRIVGDIHYLHFGCILFVITLVVTVVVTILTEPIEKDYLYRLTFWTRHSAKIRLELKDDEEESTAELVNHATNSVDSTPSPSADAEQADEPKLPTWRRAVNCLCGLETQKANQVNENVAPKQSPKEEAIQAAEFVLEDSKWYWFVNTSSIIVMSIAAFMWAWYA